MLPLSLAAKIEKNKIATDSCWITLLEIFMEGQDSIKICSNNVDVTWNNAVWTAFPFTVDQVTQNKTEIPTVPIKVSNITRVIEQYIEQYGGLVGTKVILRVINSNFLENAVAEVEETFTIESTTADAQWATFNLGGSLPVKMRFPFRRILKDWCPFVYKGIECAATSDLETCPHTLKGCRERNNSKRFGGEYSISTGGIYVSNK